MSTKLAKRIDSGATVDGLRWCTDHKNFTTALWVETDDGGAIQDCYHCCMESVPFENRKPKRVADECDMPWCNEEAEVECPHCARKVCNAHFNIYSHDIVCHGCLSTSSMD